MPGGPSMRVPWLRSNSSRVRWATCRTTSASRTSRMPPWSPTAARSPLPWNPGLWFILGHYANWRATGDVDTLRRAWPALGRALLWLRYQDSNECGLLEVHEAMDWADLFANRYNVLYDNVLYYAAWR